MCIDRTLIYHYWYQISTHAFHVNVGKNHLWILNLVCKKCLLKWQSGFCLFLSFLCKQLEWESDSIYTPIFLSHKHEKILNEESNMWYTASKGSMKQGIYRGSITFLTKFQKWSVCGMQGWILGVSLEGKGSKGNFLLEKKHLVKQGETTFWFWFLNIVLLAAINIKKWHNT